MNSGTLQSEIGSIIIIIRRRMIIIKEIRIRIMFIPMLTIIIYFSRMKITRITKKSIHFKLQMIGRPINLLIMNQIISKDQGVNWSTKSWTLPMLTKVINYLRIMVVAD